MDPCALSPDEFPPVIEVSPPCFGRALTRSSGNRTVWRGRCVAERPERRTPRHRHCECRRVLLNATLLLFMAGAGSHGQIICTRVFHLSRLHVIAFSCSGFRYRGSSYIVTQPRNRHLAGPRICSGAPSGRATRWWPSMGGTCAAYRSCRSAGGLNISDEVFALSFSF
jgi:hypothetical protein